MDVARLRRPKSLSSRSLWPVLCCAPASSSSDAAPTNASTSAAYTNGNRPNERPQRSQAIMERFDEASYGVLAPAAASRRTRTRTRGDAPASMRTRPLDPTVRTWLLPCRCVEWRACGLLVAGMEGLREAVAAFDDGSGHIRKEELFSILTTLGEPLTARGSVSSLSLEASRSLVRLNLLFAATAAAAAAAAGRGVCGADGQHALGGFRYGASGHGRRGGSHVVAIAVLDSRRVPGRSLHVGLVPAARGGTRNRAARRWAGSVPAGCRDSWCIADDPSQGSPGCLI